MVELGQPRYVALAAEYPYENDWRAGLEACPDARCRPESDRFHAQAHMPQASLITDLTARGSLDLELVLEQQNMC